jgi:hypothetical protein
MHGPMSLSTVGRPVAERDWTCVFGAAAPLCTGRALRLARYRSAWRAQGATVIEMEDYVLSDYLVTYRHQI